MSYFSKRLSVREFIRTSNDVWRDLRTAHKPTFGCEAGDSEIRSWQHSLPALAGILERVSGIEDCQIYLEYGMPSAGTRADVILVGLDSNTKRAAIVFELKQWDAKSVFPDGQNVRIGSQLHLHPSEQALGYREYLSDLSGAFSDLDHTIRSCCFLHNSTSITGRHLTLAPFHILTELSPVFFLDQTDEMVGWIGSVIKERPDSRYLSDLNEGKVRISKNLFDKVAQAVREEPAWVLLDEQRIVYNEIQTLVDKDDGQKHLVLVTGGPGTGKSVIAMQLMGELSRKGISCVHVTNSSSFTTVMQSLIQQRGSRIWGTTALKGLFRLSHNWVRRHDFFKVAICDEAHRFRRSTTLRYLRSNRLQAEELFENVQILVAFIDEKQILRHGEEGTIAYFRECAKNVGVESSNIHGPIDLPVQFRCRGNNEFIRSLDGLLYEDKIHPFVDQQFGVVILESVEDLERKLEEKITDGYSARLVAGFCWKWSDPQGDGTLIPDVTINDWNRAWNRKEEKNRHYTADSHPYTIWANRKNKQLDEVGCIYSTQGFEFDYVGVIWGRDLVWRNNGWCLQVEESFDRPLKKAPRDQALLLVKNAYRVLCSRGIRGCYIFCIDEETRERLKQTFKEFGNLEQNPESEPTLIHKK